MLEVSDLHAGYGNVRVLFGLNIKVNPGEVHCLCGRNGAGKSTTLKAIMGLVRIQSGSVELDGEKISSLPAYRIPARGIGLIPQGRRLFSELSVEENLQIGLMSGQHDAVDQHERVLNLFPRLRERLSQAAGTLSGGEQQMLAVARALCLNPKVLLLDEPTEGLQPSMVELIRAAIIRLKNEGVAILLVEQRIDAVMSVADHVSFVEHGQTSTTLAANEFENRREMFSRYLGV